MKDDVVQFKVRVPAKTRERYRNALLNFPVRFKGDFLIQSYMDYVSEMAEEYVKTGRSKLGFVHKNGNFMFFDTSGIQTEIKFDISMEL